MAGGSMSSSSLDVHAGATDVITLSDEVSGIISLAMLQKVVVDSWLRAHGKTVRPELTKKQRQELKECFDLIDADGSGAIDADELITAFNVLGMRVKKSEVEKMLAEVDADGSGEVEYPEFVQIMTSKLDSQAPEGDSDDGDKAKKQTLPFQLLAQAYRRKKLMEAVMGGDKAAQERLRAKAEEAEAERLAVVAAMEAEKTNPALRYDNKTTISDVKFLKLKKEKARKKLGNGGGIPDCVVENLDDELKKIIMDTCDMRQGKIVAKSASRNASSRGSRTDSRGSSNSRGGERTIAPTLYTKELSEIGQLRTRVRHKPVLERQLVHLKAVKSIHDYLRNHLSRNL